MVRFYLFPFPRKGYTPLRARPVAMLGGQNLTTASNDTNSPSKRRDDDIPLAAAKGMKKADLKKLEKDKIRAEKKEAKEKEKMQIAERKRARGGFAFFCLGLDLARPTGFVTVTSC